MNEIVVESLALHGRTCYFNQNAAAGDLLIEIVDAREAEGLADRITRIRALAPGIPFSYAAIPVEYWNAELSPWEAPAVFGKAPFGAGAADTLSFLETVLLPEIAGTKRDQTRDLSPEPRCFLGGYSLAGLFALWTAYETDRFAGVAAASPSVWFPGWIPFARSHAVRSPAVYLSLGDREEKAKNPTLAGVGACIRQQEELLRQDPAVRHCVLEWNPGNHFADADLRVAKGFAWLLRQTDR